MHVMNFNYFLEFSRKKYFKSLSECFQTSLFLSSFFLILWNYKVNFRTMVTESFYLQGEFRKFREKIVTFAFARALTRNLLIYQPEIDGLILKPGNNSSENNGNGTYVLLHTSYYMDLFRVFVIYILFPLNIQSFN